MSASSSYLIVFLGAGTGGALRHGVNEVAARFSLFGLSPGTLAVNVAGSLAIGLLAGFFALRGESTHTARLLLATGILGGFTTFSAFSLELSLLLERGQLINAFAYGVVSVVFAVGGVFVGLAATRALGAPAF